MCAIVGVMFTLFGGLFAVWLLFDWFSALANIYEAQTNTMSVGFKSFVDLFVISIPLILFGMAFVAAYTQMKQKRKQR